MRVSGDRLPLGLIALVLALGFISAYPMQNNGANQTSHYALAQAIEDGTPTIDRSQYQVGISGTADSTAYHGHVYAAKPPGLALLSIPVYVVMEASGMNTTGDPTRGIWILHLWAIVLPALLMFLLLSRITARLGGDALAAVVALAVGGPILPWSTLFFAHVLSAFLGTAAFAALLLERRRPDSRLLVLAGVLCGYAVASDLQVGIIGVVLGFYVIGRAPRVRRGVIYGLACVAGVMPLLLFDWWAFRAPFHLAYSGWEAGRGEHMAGTYGLRNLPSWQSLDYLLFGSSGYLVLAPVTALGVVGGILLWRRGAWRAEAAVVLAVPLAFLLFQVTNPFGGYGMARYVIAAFPFLAIGIGVAFQALPVTVVTLTGISAVQMAIITATGPLSSYDGRWMHRLAIGDTALTAASLVGVTGAIAFLPFYGAVLGIFGALATRLRAVTVTRRDVVATVGSLLAWALLAGHVSNPLSALPTVLCAAAAAAAVVAWRWRQAPSPRVTT